MSSTEPGTASRGTIVIVDDDYTTRALLRQILTRANFSVHACENGEIGCAVVLRELPDVVLLDWMMPVMDGPTAVARLKADLTTRGIPIIMLTTQSQIEERVAALEAGVQDFLTKPFDARELVARIEQQMRWRRTLAVDANTAFAGDRLHLYRPDADSAAAEQEPGSSFFDRIWGSDPPKLKKKRFG